MIKISYFKTIYIRFTYNENDTINDDSYLIDVADDSCMVIYKNGIGIEIATFKDLFNAVEYVKLKIESELFIV